MICPSTLPPTDRFSLIIRCLVASVIGRESALSHALTSAIRERLVRISARFAALVARVRAGKLFVARGPRGKRAALPDAVPADPAAYVPPKLPRGFAWLLPLVPDAANYGSQLTHLLEDPQLASWVAASPGLVRLLRPMARMLGVNPLPALLALPPRVRRARPARRAKARKAKRRPAYRPTAVLGGFEYHAPRRRGGFSSA